MKNNGKKISITLVYVISFLVLALLLYIPLGLCVIYNEHYAYDKVKPYSSYIYSESRTEYKINDGTTAKELYDKLVTIIKSDSLAMYGKKETGYMSRKYNDTVENALVTYSGKKGINEGRGKGPRSYFISFLVPYENRNLRLSGNFFYPEINGAFIKYCDKVIYSIEIIDSQPVTYLVSRGKNIDDHMIFLKLDKYVETNYLDKICKYDKRNFLNWYFFCARWAYYHFYYVFLIFILLFFIIFSIERHLKRERLRRIAEDRFFGIID